MQFRDERFWKTFALSPFLAIAEDIIFVKKKKKREREREWMTKLINVIRYIFDETII